MGERTVRRRVAQARGRRKAPAQPGSVERRGPRRVPWFRVYEGTAVAIAVTALVLQAISYEQERIIAAWQLLMTEGSGNGGKVEALEFLNEPAWFGLFGREPRGQLDRIDLRPGLGEDGAVLDGLVLENASLRGARLDRASLDHARLVSPDLEGASLGSTVSEGLTIVDALIPDLDIGEAIFFGATLEKVRAARIKSGNAYFAGGRVTNSSIRFTGEKLVFLGTEVNGSTITVESGREPPAGFVWTWAESPPSTVPDSLFLIECERSDAALPDLTIGYIPNPERLSYEQVSGTYLFQKGADAAEFRAEMTALFCRVQNAQRMRAG